MLKRASQFVAYKSNTDYEQELQSEFSIESIPAVVFVDSNGKEVSRFIGFRDAKGFLEEVDKAFAKAGIN